MATKLLAMNRNRPVLPGCEFIKKTGLRKLAYDLSSHVNLDFTIYLKERLQDMFAPYVLDLDNINFDNSIAALRPSNTGNVIQIIKILLNGWTTTSRIKGGHDVYPCFLAVMDVEMIFITT